MSSAPDVPSIGGSRIGRALGSVRLRPACCSTGKDMAESTGGEHASSGGSYKGSLELRLRGPSMVAVSAPACGKKEIRSYHGKSCHTLKAKKVE